MELQLKNVGIIKEANIILDGLTLIAGENDTGKSTIGKALYSVVSGLNNADKYYKYFYNNQINSLKENIDRKLHNEILIRISEVDSKIHNIYLKEKDKLENSNNFLINFLQPFEEDIENLKKSNFYEFVSKLREYDLDESLSKELEDIKSILYREITEYEKKYFGIKKQIEIEFIDKIHSFYINSSNISILYNNKKVIDIDINNSELNETISIGEVYAKDITYIETPFVFHFDNRNKFPYLRKRVISPDGRIIIRKEISYLINHIDDLLNKLNNSNTIENNYFMEISNEVRNKIGGYIEYNNNVRKLLFKKNNNYIELSNTAVGIKSFAIIDLLLKSGVFNDKHILILDEPEVHLHPKWQIEYAKLMVKMAEELDIQILINSHSPYFIEAIQKYSKKSEKIADKTNFYLSEKQDDGYAVIKNVNNNLKSIFNTLYDAYNILDKDTLS
ncbi:AAA family ATPase [Brachyspira pulli]|uniref:AAA family ATPase n=1 Tax=Brachyspira pulli TaxID=310721 RepID=UPI003003CED7